MSASPAHKARLQMLSTPLMAIASLPASLPLPLTGLRSLPTPRGFRELHLRWSANPRLACRSLPTRCSEQKPRRGKVLKTDEELRDELQEFMSAMGLPDNRVPTVKELCGNGRKDLANIVKRRGYKAITELLLGPSGESQSSKTSKGNQDSINADLHEPAGEDCKVYQELAHKAHLHDSQKETNHLKSMLDQRMKEIFQLKKRFDDEKLALDNLKTRATAEIAGIHRMIAKKDVELHTADENLNKLKEVHIDYRASAQTVEVSGSFNGWKHKVRMNLHPSSEHINPPGYRNPSLWSAVLWLYPGDYEIKFIVDGHWKVDPLRETTTRGRITNNVLRVKT